MIDPGLRILVAVATVANALFAADNFVGTWKRAKISQTEVWQSTPDGYKITATHRTENGNSITAAREIILDGNEHPNTGPGGKWAVSSDGKTVTYTCQATGANGRPVSQTSIYAKQ